MTNTWRWLLLLVLVVFSLLGCSSDDDESGDGDAPPVSAEPVTDADSVTNEIPQNVLLVAELIDGELIVTNAGNVTMSNVTVQSTASSCVLGVLAPDNSAPCPDVASDWVVAGTGPQGQAVEVAG